MKHLIRHGHSAPTGKDLDEFQLGWCEDEKKLYINDGGNILPIENTVTDAHTFFEVYQVNEHKTVENSLNLFRLTSKDFFVYSDSGKKNPVGSFTLCAAKSGSNCNIFLLFTPIEAGAAVTVSAWSSFSYNGISTSDLGENIVLNSTSFAVQLLNSSVPPAFDADILLKLDTTNICIRLQTDSNGTAIVKGETTYGAL